MFPSNYLISNDEIESGKILSDVNRNLCAIELHIKSNSDVDEAIVSLYMESMRLLKTLDFEKARQYRFFGAEVLEKMQDVQSMIGKAFESIIPPEIRQIIYKYLPYKDQLTVGALNPQSQKLISDLHSANKRRRQSSDDFDFSVRRKKKSKKHCREHSCKGKMSWDFKKEVNTIDKPL